MKDRIEQSFVRLLVEEGPRDEELSAFPDAYRAVKTRVAADERNVLVARRPARYGRKDGRIART